jgi:hypothetical protein
MKSSERIGPKDKKCGACKGSGRAGPATSDVLCTTCGGSGYVKSNGGTR